MFKGIVTLVELFTLYTKVCMASQQSFPQGEAFSPEQQVNWADTNKNSDKLTCANA